MKEQGFYGNYPTALSSVGPSEEEFERAKAKDLAEGPGRISVTRINNAYVLEAQYQHQNKTMAFKSRMELFEALNGFIQD